MVDVREPRHGLAAEEAAEQRATVGTAGQRGLRRGRRRFGGRMARWSAFRTNIDSGTRHRFAACRSRFASSADSRTESTTGRVGMRTIARMGVRLHTDGSLRWR